MRFIMCLLKLVECIFQLVSGFRTTIQPTRMSTLRLSPILMLVAYIIYDTFIESTSKFVARELVFFSISFG